MKVGPSPTAVPRGVVLEIPEASIVPSFNSAADAVSTGLSNHFMPCTNLETRDVV